MEKLVGQAKGKHAQKNKDTNKYRLGKPRNYAGSHNRLGKHTGDLHIEIIGHDTAVKLPD